jgi:hypothetical protein
MPFVGFTSNLHNDAVRNSHYVWHCCEELKRPTKLSGHSVWRPRYEQTDGTILVRCSWDSWWWLKTDWTKTPLVLLAIISFRAFGAQIFVMMMMMMMIMVKIIMLFLLLLYPVARSSPSHTAYPTANYQVCQISFCTANYTKFPT